MKKRIGIQGTLGISSAILALVFHKYLFPQWKNEFFDEISDVLGLLMILTGFLFRVAARGHKSENTNNGNSLVIDGPYAMTRNPMYTGTLFMTSGVIIAVFNWWLLLVLAIGLFFIYIPQISKEETGLYQRFGDTYKNYCAKVGRFFPSWSAVLGIRRHLAIRLSWLKREQLSIISVVGIVMLVEIWQDVMLFGTGEILSEFLEIALVTGFFMAMVFILRKK